MPKPNEKPNQAVNTQPSPGLLSRLFGQGISDKTSQEWPDLAQAWASRSAEMPRETAMTRSVRPMNAYERFVSGDASAVTWPWGTIALNRPAIEADKTDLNSTLTHELTHVGQRPSLLRHLQNTVTNALSGLGYTERPEEADAFAAERAYKKPKDIYLGPSPALTNRLMGGGGR